MKDPDIWYPKEDNVLKGKTFCITGALGRDNRPTYIDYIKKCGGSYRSSVSSKLDYLVTNADNYTVKRQKAESFGVKIITEDQLYNMIEKSKKIKAILED